jgi:hypothetical protein
VKCRNSCRQDIEEKASGSASARLRRKVNRNKNPKDTKVAGGETDWFHLLLEIERRFRAEERKNLRSQCEITSKFIKKPSADC